MEGVGGGLAKSGCIILSRLTPTPLASTLPTYLVQLGRSSHNARRHARGRRNVQGEGFGAVARGHRPRRLPPAVGRRPGQHAQPAQAGGGQGEGEEMMQVAGKGMHGGWGVGVGLAGAGGRRPRACGTSPSPSAPHPPPVQPSNPRRKHADAAGGRQALHDCATDRRARRRLCPLAQLVNEDEGRRGRALQDMA